MNKNRREFLQLTGAAAAGLALSGLPLSSLAIPGTEASKKIGSFGLQLYSVRDVIPKDPRGVLKQIASFGYKQIESYEGAQGMFWGLGNTGFKKYMDELGMSIVSSHCDINKDFNRKAAEAAAIGMQYLICPWLGPQKSLDDFKKAAARFNECGNICKKEGIRFAYHNHDYSFKMQDGQLPQDVMLNETDPALVDFEMDIYWVVTSVQDPESWMKKYKNRFRLCHVKDRAKGSTKREDTCDLGTGSINYKKIVKTAAKYGMSYYIVEQEHYPNGSSLDAVRTDAAYMKTLSV